MKARELQIGDLLYYKGKFNAFPFKVESITKKKVGYHAEPNEHRMYYLRLSDCEPILLTPEILEKNGFVFMPGLWYLRTKERKPIQIVFKDNNVITLSINATPVPIGLKYVHQLQHALRLCGIKKEIV
jgi:hypothetical protein